MLTLVLTQLTMFVTWPRTDADIVTTASTCSRNLTSPLQPSEVRGTCTMPLTGTVLDTHTHNTGANNEYTTTTITTVLRPFFRDQPGEPVPKENLWTLWCKGRLTEADTPTIRLGATPSGLTSAHLHHPPIFLQDGCPSCRPTNSVKALKAKTMNIHL